MRASHKFCASALVPVLLLASIAFRCLVSWNLNNSYSVSSSSLVPLSSFPPITSSYIYADSNPKPSASPHTKKVSRLDYYFSMIFLYPVDYFLILSFINDKVCFIKSYEKKKNRNMHKWLMKKLSLPRSRVSAS